MVQAVKKKNITLMQVDIDRINDLIAADVALTASAVIRRAVKELHKREMGE